jgi:putative SOS response-associated peptidase YedK
VLRQPKQGTQAHYNVRDDKLRISDFWRDSFEGRRCLVPASSFCEPNGGTRATLKVAPGVEIAST